MCGCRNTSSPGAAPTPATPRGHVAPAASAATAVLMAFKGARALLIRGPVTGTGYACYPGDRIRVQVRDVEALLATGAFVRLA